MENNNVENKNLVKILIGIIIALVLVIGFIIIGGGIYQFVSMKNKISEMEKVQKEQEKRQLENQMMASVQTQTKENNKKSETKTNETKTETKEVDPYERRFTASDMNDTLVEIKGVRDGNKVLVRVLEGKNKNKKTQKWRTIYEKINNSIFTVKQSELCLHKKGADSGKSFKNRNKAGNN